MTIQNILDYNEIIKAIIDNATDVNALIKFKLLGMLKQFEPVVANYETIRSEKIMKYGTTNEDGNTGIFAPKKENFDSDEDFNKATINFEETVKKFSDELNEVLQSESDIEIKKFKSSDIMDAGLPADYLLAIYDLIEE
jgi:hypothetical protein